MNVDKTAEKKSIPQTDWEWFGYPGHFIAADRCRFRLCTKVGDYLISTVGDMHYDDQRRTIGAGEHAFFETYVFKAGPRCSIEGCGCGQPTLESTNEIDGKRCGTGAEAQALHLKFCEKYARLGARADE